MQFLFGSEFEAPLLTFRDYIKLKYAESLHLEKQLSQQGIPIYSLFLQSDSPHFSAIMQESKQFMQNPTATQYSEASWQNGDLSAHPHNPSHNYEWLKNGPVTCCITALCLIVYILQSLGFEEPIMDLFHYPAGPYEDSELWRYLSHTLVHLSLPHILFNLAYFWLFGGAIEQRFGSLKLLLLSLSAAIVSGICQNYATGPDFFGLSGVVCAVLGYVLSIDRLKPHTFELPSGFFSMLLVGLAIGFISPLFGIYLGNSAHISGVILGVAWGYWDAKVHLKI